MKSLIIIVIIIALLILYLNKKRQKEYQTNISTTNQTTPNQEQGNKFEYKNCYQRQLLFTKNEYNELKKLKEYASQNNLEILAKVRLLDLLTPIKSKENYQSLFYKIQAKHVDFIILDKNYYIKGIIEIDDNSHNLPERKERDTFVDQILIDTGYKVLRTRYLSNEKLNEFLKEQS